MAILPRQLLRSFFEKGDKPTQSQFAALIDSMLHSSEDHTRLGLRVYDPSHSYLAGDAVLYNDSLFLALVNTSGSFNSAHWRKVLAFGSLTYRGLWNAATNSPALANGVGIMGDYYIVSNSGSTSLDGNSTWVTSDYVIFNGTKWERAIGFGIDNQEAAEVPYDNTSSGIASTDVQGAIDTLAGDIAAADNDIAALTTDLATLTSTAEYAQNKGQANGYAGLDATARIDESFLPQSVLGATKFKGFWNASANEITSSDPAIDGDPVPAADMDNEGWYFIVSTPGNTTIDTISEWGLGDWIISIGTVWKKVNNTDALVSFNGRTGVVLPQTGDYTPSMVGLGNVPNVNATDPSNITQDASHRFVTDSEKTTWNSKVDANTVITGATGTKITYDSKGLVTAGGNATTDDITEGSSLYHTSARVLAVLLSGLSTATNAVITASDSILSALGKLQAQITGNTSSIATNTTSIGSIKSSRSFGLTLDGNGGVISTGSKGYTVIPFAGEITSWYVVGDQPGSITMDVKRSGTSIVGAGNKPSLSSEQRANASVSGWTSTTISANDEIEFNVDSATTVTRVNLIIQVTQS